MKRFFFILLLILVFCAAVFFTSSLPVSTPDIPAENGVLDLRGADFQSSIYALDGEWELYFGRLYTPEQLRGNPSPDREAITLPARWTSVGHPALGYATFRLTIETDREEPLLLYIPEIMSSAVVWSNGEVLYRAGEPGTSASEMVTGVRNELLTVTPREGQIELVVQAANYHMNGSGLFYQLLLGRDTVLLHRVIGPRIVVAAVLGGILLIGVYHLILFLFRRRDWVYLSFSVTCLLTVLRLSMESNAFVQYFRPDGIGLVLSRVFLLLFTFHSVSIIVFMLLAFSIRLGRAMRLVFLSCALIPVAAICFAPYARAVTAMFLIMIPLAIAIVMGLRSWLAGKNPYQLLYLLGSAIFIVYGPLGKTLLEGELFVPATVPNLFLILSQCVMLSQNYVAAHNEVERVNANLENLVEQRTRELHQTNLRLSASQAALREMIGNISHDLKTPLTALNNYLELMGDEAQQSSEQEKAEYLGIAYHKNLDLQRLVHNLFEVTRLEGGAATYSPVPVPASALMEEAARKYEAQCRDRGIAFSARAEDGAGLYIDRDKIWSVLDNLVYNAMRHTPEGGRISIAARASGETTALTVSDTGEGIAAEHLPHIFERFYKASPERGKKDGSSGLGLYIVKTIIEAMGGAVTVESEPGQGTVFTLTFPAGDEAENLE